MLVEDKNVMEYILSIDPNYNQGLTKPIVKLSEPEPIEIPPQTAGTNTTSEPVSTIDFA